MKKGEGQRYILAFLPICPIMPLKERARGTPNGLKHPLGQVVKGSCLERVVNGIFGCENA